MIFEIVHIEITILFLLKVNFLFKNIRFLVFQLNKILRFNHCYYYYYYYYYYWYYYYYYYHHHRHYHHHYYSFFFFLVIINSILYYLLFDYFDYIRVLQRWWNNWWPTCSATCCIITTINRKLHWLISDQWGQKNDRSQGHGHRSYGGRVHVSPIEPIVKHAYHGCPQRKKTCDTHWGCYHTWLVFWILLAFCLLLF